MSGGFLQCFRRLFGRYGEGIWTVWGVLLEGVEGYLEGVQGCLEDVGRVSGGCGEAVWRVKQGCLEGVGRLSGGCGEAV